jgi:hypothetical protein
MKNALKLNDFRTKIECVELFNLPVAAGSREVNFPDIAVLRNKLIKRIWWNDDSDKGTLTLSGYVNVTANIGQYLVARNRKGEATQTQTLRDLRRQTLRIGAIREAGYELPSIEFEDDMRINQILDVPKCSIKANANCPAWNIGEAIELFFEYYILPDGLNVDGETLKQ